MTEDTFGPYTLTEIEAILDGDAVDASPLALADEWRHVIPTRSPPSTRQEDNPRPSTSIKPATTPDGREFDACYLEYRGQELLVTPTEYALLQGLLSDEGIDLEEAGDERYALRKDPRMGGSFSQTISDESAAAILSKLRVKIEDAFPDLVIPRALKNGTGRLRLWTRNELEELPARLANPNDGICLIIDERGRRRLFVSKREIRPDAIRIGISQQYFALASILLNNVIFSNPVCLNLRSPSFLARWRELTGNDGISPESFKVFLSNLRRAFEVVGWTITQAPVGRGQEEFAHQLVPYKSISRPSTFVKTKTMPDGRTFDVCYLKHGRIKVSVTPAEYVLLRGLIDGGINAEKASDQRRALKIEGVRGHPRQRQAVMSDALIKTTLNGLRKKIEATFSDLVLPTATSGNLERLRLLTRTEIDEIREHLLKPDDGICLIVDEHGQRHLFVDKHEICPNEQFSGIGQQHFALASILLGDGSIKLDSQSFLALWRELTGKDGISSGSLSTHLTHLKRAFQPVKRTIVSHASSNPALGARTYELVSFNPEQSEEPERSGASFVRQPMVFSVAGFPEAA